MINTNIIFLCIRMEIRGPLVFTISVCLGKKALTLSMKFECMAKRLHIWHVYSTNKTFQDDCKINDLDRDLYSKNSCVCVTSFILGHYF